MSEYLFAEDHPAMSTPRVVRDEMARRKYTPRSRFRATRLGLNGITTNVATVADTTTYGAVLKITLSAPAGTRSSF